MKKTKTDFKDEIKSLNKNIVALEIYIDCLTSKLSEEVIQEVIEEAQFRFERFYK
jgi:hypothetical protein